MEASLRPKSSAEMGAQYLQYLSGLQQVCGRRGRSTFASLSLEENVIYKRVAHTSARTQQDVITSYWCVKWDRQHVFNSCCVTGPFQGHRLTHHALLRRADGN